MILRQGYANPRSRPFQFHQRQNITRSSILDGQIGRHSGNVIDFGIGLILGCAIAAPLALVKQCICQRRIYLTMGELCWLMWVIIYCLDWIAVALAPGEAIMWGMMSLLSLAVVFCMSFVTLGLSLLGIRNDVPCVWTDRVGAFIGFGGSALPMIGIVVNPPVG